MLADRQTRWDVRPPRPQVQEQLTSAPGMHPTLAAVLAARGCETPQAARSFLGPSLDDLHDPFDLPDADRAVDRILSALREHEPILVHGDYDADGVTSAALLVRFLTKLGAEVQYYIPHRFDDSYGLSERAVRAAAGQVGLILAVDCGVRDYEVIDMAGAQDQDVIVVDHHEPGDKLPEPALVINPKREDSAYPERDLAAVGLAFKLASAVCARMELSQSSLQRAFLDLVAIGTIADVAPLVGENRAMVSTGLRVLPHTRKVGLQVLLELCELTGAVSARDVAFRIGPRLNAVGRMADAGEALELLLTDDEIQARRTALRLEGLNRERRKEQETTFRDAMRVFEAEVDADLDRVVVLAREGWHRGVIGIVAAKVLEATGMPTVLLALEGPQARGSARSIEHFNIAEAMAECDDLLIRHGGHALAAGLEVEAGQVSALRERLNEIGRRAMPEGAPAAAITVDAEVSLDEVDEALAEALALMEPCGEGNPEPLLCARGVSAVDVRTVGSDGRHLKLLVEDHGRRIECIGFGLGGAVGWLRSGARVDLCFTPGLDSYGGLLRLQLQVTDIRPEGIS